MNRASTEWLDDAACVDMSLAFFSDDVALQNIAVRVCATCPVQAECWQLFQTLTTEQARWGVWAGVRPGDRIHLREVRQRAFVHRPR